MSQQKSSKKPVLEVRGLKVYYETPKGDVLAVDDISFDLYQGSQSGFARKQVKAASSTT